MTSPINTTILDSFQQGCEKFFDKNYCEPACKVIEGSCSYLANAGEWTLNATKSIWNVAGAFGSAGQLILILAVGATAHNILRSDKKAAAIVTPYQLDIHQFHHSV